jgi:hypothetical protein
MILLQDTAIHFGVLYPNKNDGKILNQIDDYINQILNK